LDEALKILIVYHSETGNTKAFAEGISGKLTAIGNAVNSVQLKTKSSVKKAPVRQDQDIDFVNLPDPHDYDVILFGGPVWAFGPSPVIVEAIRKMDKLSGKICLPFVTMAFFLETMGGNAALRYMSRILADKGAKVLPGAICKHMLHKLDNEIEKNAAKIATAISL
jgi:flavodoxin